MTFGGSRPLAVYLMSKSPLNISLVGAESTGKTMLAQALAKHYQTVWVPEYGRIYAEGKVFLPTYSQWQTYEFTEIAKGQIKLTAQLAPRANQYLFLDTDAFATSIWHRRYLGSTSRSVEKLAAKTMADYYLVLSPDVAFVQDGTRDGEHIRQWMHEEFVKALTVAKQRFDIITGPYESRAQQAISYLEKFIQEK